MKWWCSGVWVAVLVACGDGETTSVIPATTVYVAPPTATRVGAAAEPTPTAPPPTTQPPTTTLSPVEMAETEIAATLDDLFTDLDNCWGSPDECEIDALIAKYFAASDDRASRVYREAWEDRHRAGTNKTLVDRVERRVAWVTADAAGNSGTSFVCQVDDTISGAEAAQLDAGITAAPDVQKTYLRYYFEWHRQPDGTWVVTHSEAAASNTPTGARLGELPSVSEAEIAQCFSA